MDQALREIKCAVDQILGVKSVIKRKREPRTTTKKDLFISIITNIEQVINRENLMHAEFNLDYSDYNEPFFSIVDALLIMHFGIEGAGLIGFYLWERLDEDGTVNPVVLEKDTKVFLENIEDLWNLLITINPAYDS